MERHTRVLSLNGVQDRTHETKETTKRGIARRRTCVQEAGFGDFWQMNPITEYSRGTGYGRRWGGEVHPDGVTYVYDRDCAIILDLYDRPTTRNGTQYR